MIRSVSIAAIVGGLLSFAGSAGAQQQSLRPVSNASLFSVTPYAGYMAFGDFVKGPVGTSLSMKNGAVYGAQLAMQVTPNVAIVGNVAHSSTSLQAGVPFLNGLNIGSSSMWLYDGGLQLDIPTGNSVRAVKPFVQVGAGAIRYQLSPASFLKTDATNFAFNAGVGVDYQMSRAVGLRLSAKDYMGKFDVQEATSLKVNTPLAHNWALTAGLRIGF
jgi:hypothetical protein